MSPKRLENKLKKMSESLKEKDIINDFPSIVDDLEYIIRTYKLKIDGLTENQRINHIYDIENNKIEFLAELMKKYMELTWNMKFSYEVNEEMLFGSAGGYSEQRDTVVLSAIGLLINSDNIADTIKTIIHEYRHQHQFRFFHEKNINNIINYPTHFILLAKNCFTKKLHSVYDENGEFQDNQYYRDNHRRIYTEVDANNYALETIRKFLIDLYKKYPNKNNKLEEKVNLLQNELIKESQVVYNNFIQEQRLKPIYIEEIYLKRPITSKVLVNQEEKDSLLYVDKTIKDNPILKDTYEVLNIFMKDYSFKDYFDIIIDEQIVMETIDDKSKINIIYDNLINTDPMLIITKYATKRNIEGIKKFLNDHPTFKYEYKEEINELLSKHKFVDEINNLLGKKDYAIMKKERN